jgi:hypothetical protein
MFRRAQFYGISIVLALNIGCKSNDWHSSKISGTIEKCSYSIDNKNHYTYFKIKQQEYKIIITSAPGNEFSFMDIARNGDTVFKGPNSDTLFVTRAGFSGDVRFPFIVKQYTSK